MNWSEREGLLSQVKTIKYFWSEFLIEIFRFFNLIRKVNKK
jgi:hypothetical protein